MTVRTSLTPEAMQEPLARLSKANHALAVAYPGEPSTRQAVHTVYGGAHLFQWDSAQKLGNLAQRALEEYAPDFITFAAATGLARAEALPCTESDIAAARRIMEVDPDDAGRLHPVLGMAHTVYSRVLRKLRSEPVEDYRIDFEDGYGNRPDAEEDGHAASAASEVAKAFAAGTLPAFAGIRIKPLNEELRARSLRTLDIFLSTLLDETDGTMPPEFVVTLPKVMTPEQAATLVEICELLEEKLGLAAGTLKLELMIETTQALLGPNGEMNLPRLVSACAGRCVGAHLGAYDYTASCHITAAHQQITHPACDFARHMMQVALAGTPVRLSDGATNVLPVAPHRTSKDAPPLTMRQRLENHDTVHRAWRLHFSHCRNSLAQGFYQGWDLHPAQLPTRYAAVYSFFREGAAAASSRLKNFLDKAARATIVGDVFDDAATGQGLLNFFLRGVNCGALTENEALDAGITLDELRGRSFLKILQNRRKEPITGSSKPPPDRRQLPR